MITLNLESERKIATVHPDLQRVVRRAAELCDHPFAICQGNRTQEQQDAIYAQGRTKPGPIVTWTRNSRHIGGHAVDFAALNAHGGYDWTTPGSYPAIKQAFYAASKELGIPVTSGQEWRTKDWGHVELKGVQHEQLVSSNYPTLKLGASGASVKTLQSRLTAHGYFKGVIDGFFGNITQADVIAFQKAKGQSGDGIVGTMTWIALNAANGPVAQAEPPQTALIAPGHFAPSVFCKSWCMTFEKFAAEAYMDRGRPAQGYGHNAGSMIPPIPVMGGEAWTQEYAAHVLDIDLAVQAHYINVRVAVPISQDVVDALILDQFQQGPIHGDELLLVNGDATGAALQRHLRARPGLKGLMRRWNIIADIAAGKHPSTSIW